MSTYLTRGLAHIRNGTVLDRLRSSWWLSADTRRERRNRQRKVWWQSQIGQRDSFETKLQRGTRMRLYFDDRLAQAIYCDAFEWEEQDFLNAFLRPGDVYFDAGANIGLFTLIAASRVGARGLVHAFEPCSRVFQRLTDNIKLNNFSNVSAHQMALSDRPAQLELTISLEGFDAWNSLAQPIRGSDFSVETINAVTLDDFVHEHDLMGRLTMMKIDVEGWESHLLAGGTKTLSRADAPVLQVEFTGQAALAAGSSCTDLYRTLERLGYQMFVYDARARKIFHDPIREEYIYSNLIAAKQPEMVTNRLARSGR